MKSKLSKIFFSILMLFCVYSKIACAGTPMWTFTPLTATTLTLPNTGTATVQYTVTNQSTKPHTLAMEPITGITQDTSTGCGNPFTLSGHQSCVLSVTVQASQINGGVHGGPVVCQANPNGTPNICYSYSNVKSPSAMSG